MSKAKSILMVVCILTLAGCTETIDTISRQYRNANNEIIDAMMMITTKEKAEEMNTRVFKLAGKRYKALDGKLGTLEINQATYKEWILSVFESDSVVLYLAEMKVNQKRFDREIARLAKLHEQLVDEEKEKQGINVDPKTVAPVLFEIVASQSKDSNHPLNSFRKQLGMSDLDKDNKAQQHKSALETKMDAFAGLKGVSKRLPDAAPGDLPVPEAWFRDAKAKFDAKLRAKMEGN